jgi:hypothetical protein
MKTALSGALALLAMAAVFLWRWESRPNRAQHEPAGETPVAVAVAMPREGSADAPRIATAPAAAPAAAVTFTPAARIDPSPVEASPAPLPVSSASFSSSPRLSATPQLRQLPIEIKVTDIMTRRSHILADTGRVAEFVDILLQSSLITNDSFSSGARYTHAFFMDGVFWHYNAKTGEVGRINSGYYSGTYLIREDLRAKFHALVAREGAQAAP